MAEEPHKPAAGEAAPSGEVSVVADVPPAEKTVSENDPPAAPVPEPEPEAHEKSEEKSKAVATASEDNVVAEEEKPKAAEEEKTITQSVSFKEESYVVSELPDPQKKALDELKQLIQEALNKHEFTAPPPPPPVLKEETPAEEETKKKDEEEKTEKVEEAPKPEPPATETEPPKAETEHAKEPAPGPEPSSTETVVVVADVVEKITTADEDGAKTVEAIKETIVEVSAPATEVKEAAPATEEAASAEAPGETKEEVPAPPPPPPEEVFIWGIPLLGDERSDVVLLKFLRARDFKVKEAFTMIKNTVRWRKEFGIDSLLDEDLGSDWDKVVFTHGVDKKGHPVCYNVFGEFSNKELYQNTFGDEEKRSKFIKWRIQFLEKSIRKFDFDPTGISTIVQVNDLRNSPGLFKREHNQVTNQALQILQDNYPEFVARQVYSKNK